jgi:hypothetical protein
MRRPSACEPDHRAVVLAPAIWYLYAIFKGRKAALTPR